MSLIALVSLILIVFSPRPAGAADELYSARAVVTGRSEANRALRFATCLSNVLVKVSGDPTIEQMPDLSRLQSSAGDLVTGFNYRDLLEGIPMHDEQGSYDRPQFLTVAFDPTKIDAALLSLHRIPWRGQRPTVALALVVNGRNAKFVLTAEEDTGESAAMREAFATASAKFGIPIEIPARSVMASLGWMQGQSLPLTTQCLNSSRYLATGIPVSPVRSIGAMKRWDG